MSAKYKMKEITTLGSGVIDVFLELDIKEKNRQICVPAGQKLLVDKMWYATGGGGTNTAVSFSRMGFKTGFIGKLGKDENANTILKELKKEKIEFLGSQGEHPTGYSTVIDSVEKDRAILTFRGANSYLKMQDIKLNKLKTSWLYFASMIEESLLTQQKLADFAAKKGIKIAYNPSSYVILNNKQVVKDILKKTEILILNEKESFDLVGKGDVFKMLHALGPRIVCITYGEKGNKVCDRNSVYTSIPNKIKAVERTGAGDAFSSGFVSGFIRFNDVERAMKIGSANAESIIQKPGAKNGLLSWNQALKEMKKIRVVKSN